MSNALIDRGLPPRWGLQIEAGARDGRVLWFGSKRIALADIQTVTAEEVRERPVAGLLLGANAFLIVAMIFAFAVFEFGWRDRFLLGTLFLAFLGTAGLWEMTKIGKQSFYEIKIGTGSQGLVTFATTDISEVEAFLGALAGAGVKS
jgi:Family of unknown function (DUF6232)